MQLAATQSAAQEQPQQTQPQPVAAEGHSAPGVRHVKRNPSGQDQTSQKPEEHKAAPVDGGAASLAPFNPMAALMGLMAPRSAAGDSAGGAAEGAPATPPLATFTNLAPKNMASKNMASLDTAPKNLAPKNVAPKNVASLDTASLNIALPNVALPNLAPPNLAPPNLAPLGMAPLDMASLANAAIDRRGGQGTDVTGAASAATGMASTSMGLIVTGKETHLAPVSQTPSDPRFALAAALDAGAVPVTAQKGGVAPQAAVSLAAISAAANFADASLTPVNSVQAGKSLAAAKSKPDGKAPDGKAAPSLESGAIVDAAGAGVTVREAVVSSSPAEGGSGGASNMEAKPHEARQGGAGTDRGAVTANQAGGGFDVGMISNAQAGQASLPSLSPAEQIANKISEALTSGPAAGADIPGGASGTPVKVLRIQLHPADLGEVTVRLTLRQDGLEVQVEATRHDTVRMVEKNREALSDMLRSAGYSVEALTVRAAGESFAGAASQQAGAGGSSSPDPSQQPGWTSQERRNQEGARERQTANERVSGIGEGDAGDDQSEAVARDSVYV